MNSSQSKESQVSVPPSLSAHSRNQSEKTVKRLLLFSTLPEKSHAGADYAKFKLIKNRATGKTTVQLDRVFESVELSLDVVDGPSIARVISSIFESIGWISAQTSAHEVVNHAPKLLPKDLVKGIISKTMVEIREEDNVPTIDEFMAKRYTEVSTDESDRPQAER